MGETAAPRALVYGVSRDLLGAPPSLLSRAGFDVTLISSNRDVVRCRNVATLMMVEGCEPVFRVALAEAKRGYDMIVAGDDFVLHDVIQSDLTLEDKLLLLPVNSARGLAHIASKAGLSEVLMAHGIPTPRFAVARTLAELPAAIAQIGYPVVVKSDFSMGGYGVRMVRNSAELGGLHGIELPAVVQEFLPGATVDCSALYRRGELLSFNHAVLLEGERGGRGPSIARRYWTRAEDDEDLSGLLRRLGHALDADGFVNITGIRGSDGQLRIFEADMRPNTWIEYPRYYGRDPAVALAKACGLPPPPQSVDAAEATEFMDMGYAPRMRLIDIARNRYNGRTYFEDYLQRGLVTPRLGALRRRWLSPRYLARRILAALLPR